jgi:hypothetical protein
MAASRSSPEATDPQYYHIELADHDVVFADGCHRPVETQPAGILKSPPYV